MSCMYCDGGEKLQQNLIEICALPASTLYLSREQSYPGRCVLVFNRHAEELSELSAEEQRAFMSDLCAVVGAAKAIFSADKVNCGIFGDTVKHTHVHIVPKREGGLDWGGVFQMNPRRTYLEERDYTALVRAYRTRLQGRREAG